MSAEDPDDEQLQQHFADIDEHRLAQQHASMQFAFPPATVEPIIDIDLYLHDDTGVESWTAEWGLLGEECAGQTTSDDFAEILDEVAAYADVCVAGRDFIRLEWTFHGEDGAAVPAPPILVEHLGVTLPDRYPVRPERG
jgi:hypothetical protein